MAYSDKVIDHYENPRNVGTFDKDDSDVGTGMVGAPACGDVMRLQIKVNDQGIIEDAKFKTYGCGSAIASSSLITEWVKGKSLDDALAIKKQRNRRRIGTAARENPLLDFGGRRGESRRGGLQKEKRRVIWPAAGHPTARNRRKSTPIWTMRWLPHGKTCPLAKAHANAPNAASRFPKPAAVPCAACSCALPAKKKRTNNSVSGCLQPARQQGQPAEIGSLKPINP